MNFADLDAVMDEAGQGVLRLLILHGKVAGVIIDAEMLRQPFVAGMLGAEMVEEFNRFPAGLQQAERFRFETEGAACVRSSG